MQVCVINNTEPKNASIPLAALAGGGAGLALRHVMPVGKPEIDYVMFNQSDSIKQDYIKAARKSVIADAKKLLQKNPENEALDLFVKITSPNKDTDKIKDIKEQIAKSSKEVKAALNLEIKKLAVKIRAARNLTESNIKNAVRQKRPFGPFILPGIALGALGAYVYNVIGTISEDV